MKQWLEIFSLLFPFVTFTLGILLTPFVESRKEKSKAKSIQKNLIIEIEDELSELPEKLSKMAYTLESLILLKEKQPKIGGSAKYIPRNTFLYFLKPAAEASFFLFNKDQRYAIKSLFTQVSAIDDYLHAIKKTTLSEQTLDENIKNCKRYLYTGTCMLNTMRVIASHPLADQIRDDKETIDAIFSELSIDLTSKDLRIVSTTTFH